MSTDDQHADSVVIALLSVLLTAMEHTTDPQMLADLTDAAQAAVDAAQTHQTPGDAR